MLTRTIPFVRELTVREEGQVELLGRRLTDLALFERAKNNNILSNAKDAGPRPTLRRAFRAETQPQLLSDFRLYRDRQRWSPSILFVRPEIARNREVDLVGLNFDGHGGFLFGEIK